MALHIKNAEVESLAAEVAKLAHESKTEAIRVALRERVLRLKSSRDQRIDGALRRFREQFPKGDFGYTITREEEERILGFGRSGV
ncbi:MAG: type II toxin-antitoxin system VapB family antitoxin [Acidobacteriota bacterium]